MTTESDKTAIERASTNVDFRLEIVSIKAKRIELLALYDTRLINDETYAIYESKLRKQLDRLLEQH